MKKKARINIILRSFNRHTVSVSVHPFSPFSKVHTHTLGLSNHLCKVRMRENCHNWKLIENKNENMYKRKSEYNVTKLGHWFHHCKLACKFNFLCAKIWYLIVTLFFSLLKRSHSVGFIVFRSKGGKKWTIYVLYRKQCYFRISVAKPEHRNNYYTLNFFLFKQSHSIFVPINTGLAFLP